MRCEVTPINWSRADPAFGLNIALTEPLFPGLDPEPPVDGEAPALPVPPSPPPPPPPQACNASAAPAQSKTMAVLFSILDFTSFPPWLKGTRTGAAWSETGS
jgi:hypothetical protein